ncbi:MAG: hypothetical protein P9L92_15205 [Candidatus Electryonea clarkiae]|nr:hypothetical protein [Candidatus Electryonea clarkiae]MDP8287528.1 hypothetical protein [Candidatus Electryonea clarkiae]
MAISRVSSANMQKAQGQRARSSSARTGRAAPTAQRAQKDSVSISKEGRARATQNEARGKQGKTSSAEKPQQAKARNAKTSRSDPRQAKTQARSASHAQHGRGQTQGSPNTGKFGGTSTQFSESPGITFGGKG